MSKRLVALVPLALVVLALVAPADAGAIPAFARRYRFSCTTCHAPFPRLKPFGIDFAGRGFGLPPGQEPARANLDLGDDLLQLPRDFPISLRFDAFAQVQDEGPELDFQTPWIFKLLAGGRIADGVGFFSYYILEQGAPGKLEDTYIQFSEVFGLPLDVLVGQFQVSDAIVKRELRLERLDYEILTTTVGDSIVDLTYDRGVALAAAAGPVDAFFTVTNGTGIGETGVSGTFDRDAFKNFGLQLAVGVGPAWLAAYGFYGRERGPTGAINRTIYYGPEVGVGIGGEAQLLAVYLERRDTNPTFVAAGAREIVTRGGFGELVWLPLGSDGRLALAALYNRVDSDLDASDVESAALDASWLFRRNVRIVAEAQRDLAAKVWRGSIGTVASF